MNPLAPCVLAALVIGQSEPPLAGPEWPAYKGDAGLTGMSADDTIRPPFKLAWSYRLDGDASSDAGAGVTVAGGKVFVNVHNTRSILALDARTGRFAWEYKGQAIGYMTAPTYADGQLFLWLRQRKKAAVVVLDAATGKELRQHPLSVEALAYYRNRLWVRNVHYLVELDPATGKRLRLGDAAWGWGGMGFQNNRLFVSGIQSQYGNSGATFTDL